MKNSELKKIAVPTCDTKNTIVNRFLRTGSGGRLDQRRDKEGRRDHGQTEQEEVDEVEREVVLEEERELEE